MQFSTAPGSAGRIDAVTSEPHNAQAFATADGSWAMMCATCHGPDSVKTGLTADAAYAELSKHAENPEAWVTPSGQQGYRTRRGTGPLGGR